MTNGQKPFWKRLPVIMDISQRLAFEGIGLACEAIDDEQVTFRQALSNGVIDGEEFKLGEADRRSLFRSAWSAIDAADVLRQLLYYQRKNINFELSNNEAACLQAVQNMRNKRDHPVGTINRIAKKAYATPLYGILTFAWHGSGELLVVGDEITIRGRHAAILSIASSHHQFSIHKDRIFDESAYNIWGNPRLHVDDDVLLIDDIWKLSKGVIEYFENVISVQVSIETGGNIETTDKANGPLAHSITTKIDPPRTTKLIR